MKFAGGVGRSDLVVRAPNEQRGTTDLRQQRAQAVLANAPGQCEHIEGLLAIIEDGEDVINLGFGDVGFVVKDFADARGARRGRDGAGPWW